MIYNFDKIYDRRNTNCFKWDKNKEIYGKENVISLWVADMDLPSAPPIQDAIINRARHPIFGYTFRNDDFYQAFINWQSRRNNWRIEPQWILNSTSVVVSLNLIIRALTQPGDGILILSPVYSQFAVTINDTGRNIISSSLLSKNEQYEIDFADLENKLAAGIKIMVFCSPHNPVGRVWNINELQKVAELCLKYNTVLVSDEIHSDLVFSESRHTPIASLSTKISQNTITCLSPGKTFNISGLSIGFIIIENSALRKKINNIFLTHHLLAANIFGITACQTAYSQCAPWLDQALVYLQKNRDFLLNYLKIHLPLIELKNPQGTYLAWLDFKKYRLSQKHLMCFLVQTAGLGLDNGLKYGKEGDGFMRLNFACSRILLKKALDQLKTASQILFEADFNLHKIIDNLKDIEDCD